MRKSPPQTKILVFAFLTALAVLLFHFGLARARQALDTETIWG